MMGESLNDTDTTQAEIDSILHIVRTETDGIPLISSPQLEQITGSILDYTSTDTDHIQGTTGDITYTLDLPQRPGSHNATYIATLHGEQDVQFILKRGTDVNEQTQAYAQWVQDYPLIADYTARVYGHTPDEWIAIEYLEGLNYEQIMQEMDRSDTFNEAYSRTAYQAIDRITAAGLQLNDVNFADGHNVVLDNSIGEDWQIHFLEHGNIRPATLNLQPHENSFTLFCKELTTTMPQPGEQANPERLQFTFALMRQALDSHEPDSYYLRPMRRQSSHSEEGAPINYTPLPVSAFVIPRRAQQLQAGYTFSPDLVRSIQAGDFDTFCQVVLTGQHATPMAADDPRSQPNTII